MIYLVVAFDKNHLIGQKSSTNGIPWHIKEDLQHFKALTIYKTILMGKKTFEAIGKPLPNRKTIVVSNEDVQYPYENVVVEKNLDEVLKSYKNSDEELYICGGASIYQQSLPYVDEMIVSKIMGEYIGEIYFPDFSNQNFECVKKVDKSTFTLEYYRRK